LLLATGVGAPLGLLALSAYAAGLLLGYAYAGVALGQLALTRLRKGAPSVAGRAFAAAVALLLLALVSRIPILGGIIAALALIIGAGALVLQLRAGGRTAAA
jgi:hypothetical protein